MIRYSFAATVAALAVAAPIAALAQTVQPTPIAYADDPPAAVPGYAQPYTYGIPVYPAPVVMIAVPPGSVWLAPHYNWDATRSTYTFIEGQYVQPPHPNAQWIEGHWSETPTSWIWIDGRWN
jgi:hypothetical protein